MKWQLQPNFTVTNSDIEGEDTNIYFVLNLSHPNEAHAEAATHAAAAYNATLEDVAPDEARQMMIEIGVALTEKQKGIEPGSDPKLRKQVTSMVDAARAILAMMGRLDQMQSNGDANAKPTVPRGVQPHRPH